MKQTVAKKGTAATVVRQPANMSAGCRRVVLCTGTHSEHITSGKAKVAAILALPAGGAREACEGHRAAVVQACKAGAVLSGQRTRSTPTRRSASAQGGARPLYTTHICAQ